MFKNINHLFILWQKSINFFLVKYVLFITTSVKMDT